MRRGRSGGGGGGRGIELIDEIRFWCRETRTVGFLAWITVLTYFCWGCACEYVLKHIIYALVFPNLEDFLEPEKVI